MKRGIEMSRKEKWKKFGKNTGKAFLNFGKAMGETVKIVAGKDNNDVEPNGKTKLRNAWTDTGKGFGAAGSSLGKAFKETVNPEEPPKDPRIKKDDAIDVK